MTQIKNGDSVAPKYGGDLTKRRRSVGRFGVLATLFAACLGALTTAAAAAPTITFTPSSGGKVTVLALSEVDKCEEIKDIQAAIARSGYRVRYRSPAEIKDPRDRALFEYENEVAVRYYYLCPEGRASSDRLQFGARPAFK